MLLPVTGIPTGTRYERGATEVTALYLHNWAASDRAGHLKQAAESHQPVTTPGNNRNSLVARIALSLVLVAAVVGVVVPSPARPAAIPGHRGLPVYRLPVLPNVER